MCNFLVQSPAKSKIPCIWKLKTLMNNSCVEEEILMEIRKYSVLNDNENIMYQN